MRLATAPGETPGTQFGDVIAAEIVEDLQAALEQFAAISADLGQPRA